MDYLELGRHGPKVSAVGIGMWQAGGTSWGDDVRDRYTKDAMVRAVDVGINLVDTAEVYGDGHSEEVVGRAIRAVGRDRVFLATKVGGHHLHADHVVRACLGSRRRLHLRAIDLYQIHRPPAWEQVPLREPMQALERLEREGKIHHIGVSNFAVRDLEEARSYLSRSDIVSNQIQYSLLHREPETGILPYCRREGIGVIAWSPLAKGILSGKYAVGKGPQDRIRSDDPMFRAGNRRAAVPLVRALRGIGEAHRRSASQVALAWLIAHPGVVPIPGAKRPQQAEENAGAAGWALTRSEVRHLDRTSAAARLDTF
jgi:aryl-alcohol dehydrogenase-like predicted oxidoreductase